MITEQMKREVAVFGMTISEMEQNRATSITGRKNTVTGYAQHAMSIMSDVQEMLETDPNRKYGNIEIRQYINQAKYWMSQAGQMGQ